MYDNSTSFIREKRESPSKCGLRRMESNGALDHARPGDPWSAAGGLTGALHPGSALSTSERKIGGAQEISITRSQRELRYYRSVENL